HLEVMKESYASYMFNNMFTAEVVHFLSEIPSVKANLILAKMNKAKEKKIKSKLSYQKETEGAVMTKELISINSTESGADVLDMLRDKAPDAEIVYYLYVVNAERKLVGVVSLRDLIVADPKEVINDIMSKRVVSVPEDMDQEDVGMLIKKYDFLAVPVVSEKNHLLGIITVDDIMDILEDETTEDFGEISATKGATDVNLDAFSAAKKRSPWIITLMFFGLITGSVIGQFEETLESVVLLAVF